MFKNTLSELIKEIMVDNSDLTYLLQYGILEYTINQVLEK